MTTSVPPLPSTAPPPEGAGRVLDSFLPGAGGAPVADDHGAPDHREDELLVSGTAGVYRYGDTTDTVILDHESTYTTRIIVRRPRDPRAFSGTVVLEIGHPEMGSGPVWQFCGPLVGRRGHAHVLVTTRRNNQAYGAETPISLLRSFDPVRYGPLDFEEGGMTWDILAQVAALVRSDVEANPLAGLDVARVVAGGYSGGGAYTLMYLKLFHDRWRHDDGSPLIDAYLVGEPSWYQALSTLDDRHPDDQTVPDVDVPVISFYNMPLAPMVERVAPGATRFRPDDDTVAANGRAAGRRTYEIAGSAHVNMEGCGLPSSDLRLDHVFRLCVEHLERWVLGEPAPRGEPIAVGGEPPSALGDEHGNTSGGVRSTFVDIPRARYLQCAERGTGVMERFSPDKLRALYGSHDRYVAAVEARAAELVQQRWVLADDAAEQVATAASPSIAGWFAG